MWSNDVQGVSTDRSHGRGKVTLSQRYLFSIIILLTFLSVSTRNLSPTQGATSCISMTVPHIVPLLRLAFLQLAS